MTCKEFHALAARFPCDTTSERQALVNHWRTCKKCYRETRNKARAEKTRSDPVMMEEALAAARLMAFLDRLKNDPEL